MKKITALITLLCLVFTGCFATEVVVGNGITKTFIYDYTNFAKVDTGNNFNVIIEQSDNYYVEITCDENVKEYLDIKKTGNTLSIHLDQLVSYRKIEPTARIGMPYLESVNGSGACDIVFRNEFIIDNDLSIDLSGSSSFKGALQSKDLYIDVSGSSDVNATTIVSDIKIDLSGASNTTLNGTGKNLNLDLSGSSDVNLFNLNLENVIIELSGASTAQINASGNIKYSASGASKLQYKGLPEIKHLDLSGSSKIKKVD